MNKTMKKLMSLSLVVMACVLLFSGISHAVTQDKTVGGTIGYPARLAGRTVLLERTIDFSLSVNTGTASDVYQLLNIPAGTVVLQVSYEAETGEDSTCTIDIGDGSDTDGYFDGANVETGQTLTAVADWTLGAVAVGAGTNLTSTTTAFATNVSVTTTELVFLNATTNIATQTVVTAVSVLTDPGLATATLGTQTIYPITSAPTPYANGKLYTSADTLDMVLNNAADTLKITVRALVVPVNGLD